MLSDTDVEEYDRKTSEEIEEAFNYAEELPAIPREALIESMQK